MTEPSTLTTQDFKSTLIADLSAGLVVTLVALPLCLGVALASAAPLYAGILAGIVGGILVGLISKSQTSVSGPAAGLTAVVAAQIDALGSFEAFLLAVVIAGAFQIVLGIARAGSIAQFVPSCVIKGLLAAIGLILILKQIPHLLGHDSDVLGEMAFFQPNQENTFSQLLALVFNFEPSAAIIGLTSLAVLWGWDQSKRLKHSLVPGPLVAVLVGVGLSVLLARFGSRWTLSGEHLVQIPVADSVGHFFSFLRWPDITALGTPGVYAAALTIALVASLETVLNLEAVDKLDPQKRVSPPNRELIAQGVGNLTSGLIGGLPVTSVIVRSSVNINSGGRTKLATIVHGLLLLLCVSLLPTWLNRIPLSALAAVLIVTGFKLVKPKLFQQMWREGLNQFLPFFVTVTAIVFTDLLIGILIGLGFSIVFILRSNLRRPLHQIWEKHIGGDVLRIELANQVSFLNRVALSEALEAVPRGGRVLIDARQSDYIDVDVLELIREYEEEVAPVRGVQVSRLGLQDHYQQIEDRVRYVDYTTREMQSQLTPAAVVQILKEGNERFRTGQQLTRDLTRQLKATADGQHPLAIVLSGSSSRTPVEMIFDVGLGEIYCTRVSGNYVSTGVLGSLEFACVVAGARLILVMGHNNSALMKMAIELHLAQKNASQATGTDHLDPIIIEIQRSLDTQRIARWYEMDRSEQEACVDDLYRAHIARCINLILEQSSSIAALVEQGRVQIVGGLYNVRTGEVEFLGESFECRERQIHVGRI